MKKRLFIVSNRLPVNVENRDGEPVLKPSSGGLVSAIDSYLRQPSTQEFSSITWVGMPGCEPSDWEATAN
ncbi:MAG TPA: hypothetical protein VF145_14275, partial [Chitinophagaceae bacterium]